jgi:hypothetical protein
LEPFLAPDARAIEKVYEHQSAKLDAIFRAVSLAAQRVGKRATPGDFLIERPKPEPSSKRERSDSSTNDHDRRIGEIVDAFSPFYLARAELICPLDSNQKPPEELFATARQRYQREGWKFENRHAVYGLRNQIAESIAQLGFLGIPPTLILSTAIDLQKGWSTSGASFLFKRLAAIPDIHDHLLNGIVEAARASRAERTGAEERSNMLAGFASLIAPLSPEDASAIFKWAIDVAAELDSEVMDQLRLLGAMAQYCHLELGDHRREKAAEIVEIAYDAAIRLSYQDHFPWRAVMRGLALLDFPIALAAVARWDDSRIAYFHQTVNDVLEVALDSGRLDAASAFAICGLSELVESTTLYSISVAAEIQGPAFASQIAEDMARDELLQRRGSSANLRPFFLRHASNRWVARLLSEDVARQQADSKLDRDGRGSGSIDSKLRLEGKDESSAEELAQVWDESALIDAEQLGPALNRIVEESRSRKQYISAGDALAAGSTRLPTARRVAHLNALASLDESWDDDQIVRAILARLKEWNGSPAVDQWRAQRLPGLVVGRLSDLSRHLPYHDRELRNALNLLGAEKEQIADLVLQGLERGIERLSASAAFGLTGIVASHSSPKSVADLFSWYSKRLYERTRPDEREKVPISAYPSSDEEAVGRFHYAYLSDIDVRVRWRGAHTLRRLARLGAQQSLDAVVAQFSRRIEPAFRQNDAPFYWMASCLWTVIAMDRIALESPEILARHGAALKGIALDEQFPHAVVRDFARDACRKLAANGLLHLTEAESSALAAVNCSLIPAQENDRAHRQTFDSFGWGAESKPRRFKFDALDTLRYWYDPLLRLFSDVTPDEFLNEAEHWIVDVWGFGSDESAARDPRRKKRDDRHWAMYSTSHGSNPTLEQFRVYLEWNAMWCTTGSLMRNRPLAIQRWESDSLSHAISESKLTEPPLWLADLLSPRPLHDRRWTLPPADPAQWRMDVDDNDFLAELFPNDLPDFCVVNGAIDERAGVYRQEVSISTCLVSPATAHALVRALQTTKCSSDFYLCPEGHDLEINEASFKLTGWLRSVEGGSRLDRKDVFSNGVSRVNYVPGEDVSNRLGLVRSGADGLSWHRASEPRACFSYETWGDPVREEDQQGGTVHTACSGHRLVMRKQDLQEYLSLRKRDLIVEISITRREVSERGYGYEDEDTKRSEVERIFLFRRNGRIQAAERDFGAWR